MGGARPAGPRPLEAEVKPPWPFRLPGSGGGDRVLRVRAGVCERMLHVDGAPVRVRAWHPGPGDEVRFRAEPIDPALVVHTIDPGERRAATGEDLERAIAKMRFALATDDDLRPFYDEFRGDPLIGPAVRRRARTRVRRRPCEWEALSWAIINQLIEAGYAAEIQRRFIRRWGAQADLEAPAPVTGARPGRIAEEARRRRAAIEARRDRRRGRRGRGARDPSPLTEVPTAAAIAGRSPAELVALELAEGRAIAMIRCAREVAKGRVDLCDPASDRRLLSIPNIGPWTIQCLGLKGRGDPDSLPAGDLAYIKLVGHLAGLGRRATVEEVEEFFAPYAPFRGLAGHFALVAYGSKLTAGPQFPFDAEAAMRRDLDAA